MEDVKGDFRKLLEMMAALYNLRTGGADKELHIDQMQVRLLSPPNFPLAARIHNCTMFSAASHPVDVCACNQVRKSSNIQILTLHVGSLL